MRFTLSTALIVLTSAFAAIATPGAETTINFDDRYCSHTESMNSVACSTGNNGLVSKWPTFGSVPSFPRVGGGWPVEGYNSANCGSCYEFYDPNTGNVASVVLINSATEGFTLCTTTLLALTGFTRETVPNSVPVTVRHVPNYSCGLPE